MESPEYTIEVEKLYKRFAKVEAVNGISFKVRKGEIVGFLGPNGAGKSTTMRILTGYARASSGFAQICGIPVATNPHQIKRRIGYMPENNPLPLDLRVREYLGWRAKLKEIPRRYRKQRIEEVMKLCDLQRTDRRIIGKLSKGFRQRVGIADAILAEPEVIIMDEPTIGLDPHQVIMIRDLIASLRGKMSVIISSHILPEIEMTCDQVIIINHGKIVGQGTPNELRRTFIDYTTYHVEMMGKQEELKASLCQINDEMTIEHFGEPDDSGFREVDLRIKGICDYGETLLNCLAKNPNIRVRSLLRRQAPLEDVFLAATRRSWETVDQSLSGEADELPSENPAEESNPSEQEETNAAS